MKILLSFLLMGALLFTTPLISADEGQDKSVKEFDFAAADITGSKKKPAGSSIDSLRGTNQGTKIKPRKNFLPELSNSIDEL